jgi:hypothetical protein
MGGAHIAGPIRHGVGQGNGAGPAIWGVLSSPLLDMLRTMDLGVKWEMAISHEGMHIVGFSFVDDTDLAQSVGLEETVSNVLANMQASIDSWEGAIRATGGALVPAKSHWYLIDFQWVDGKPSYKSVCMAPGTLTLFGDSGTRVTLDRLEPSEGRRTLGARANPDGNCQEEFEYLCTESRKWADSLRTGGLDRSAIWTYTTMHILKKLEYPLSDTCLSRIQCETILRPVLQTALPAMGINRNMPRAIVYGTYDSMGLNIPNLFTSQGLVNIQVLITHGHVKADVLGGMLRTSIENHKVELGLGGSLFPHNFHTWSCLITNTWISHTWEFLHSSCMTLEEHTGNLQLLRVGDEFLMEAFYKAGYRKTHLQMLNSYCQYLQATTLADVTTGSGRHLQTLAWQGIFNHDQTPRYKWPVTPRPTKWQLWYQALQHTFHLHLPSLQLNSPLGLWYDSHQHRWWYSAQDDRVYQQGPHGTLFHSKCPTSSRTRAAQTRYHKEGQMCSGPVPHCQVAIVHSHGPHLIYNGSAPQQHHTSTPQSFAAVMSSSNLNWAWEIVSGIQHAPFIAQAIQNHTCIAVCDGSFKEAFGTAAWVLKTGEAARRLSGCCIVPGSGDDHGSYRSELTGLYTSAQLVRILCQYYSIKSGGIEMRCDGESPLNRIAKLHWTTRATEAHYDLIAATQAVMRQCPIQ